MGGVGWISAINGITVEVKFNQAVDIVTGSNKAHYSVGSLTVDAVELSEDRKTATLTLDAAAALTSTATNYVVTVADVKNASGDTIEDYAKVFSLKDDTRPATGEITFKNPTTIEFSVNEPVDENGDINAFIAIYDENGLKVNTGTEASYNLATGKIAVDVSGFDLGKHTLRITGLTDFAGNLVNPNPVNKVFTISADSVKPVVEAISNFGFDGTQGIVKVDFTEEIDQTSTEFVVEVDGTPDTSAVITDLGDGKSFLVELPSVTAANSHKITVKTFKDLAGNSGSAKSQIVAIKASAPTVTSTTYKATPAGNVVIVKFDRNVAEDTFATLTSTYLTSKSVEGTDSIATADLSVTDIDGDGIDELVIDASALSGGQHTLPLVAGLVEDNAGQANKATTVKFAVPEVAAAPTTTVTNVSQSGKEITVTFDAKVGESALNLSNYKVEGTNVFEKAVFTSSGMTAVKLTLKDDTILEDGDYLVSISNILDATGKAVKAYNANETLTETVAPKLATISVVDNATVKATFTEALNNDSSVTGADFEVKVNGVVVAATASTTGAVSTISLTAPTVLVAGDTVTVTTSTAFDGEDANGNVGKAGQTKTVKWIVE